MNISYVYEDKITYLWEYTRIQIFQSLFLRQRYS
ncbi:MAG: hypothetical protein ACI9Y7_002651 [Dokdonia sp.]|jgi:hypothetical protein